MELNLNLNINLNNNLKKIKLNFIVFGILILAGILRFYHLDFQSPWADEISTMINTNPNLSNTQLIENINTKEGFPYLYFWLMKLLHSIFGYNFMVDRFFSALVGVFSVLTFYKLAKELYTKELGYIAAFLLSINQFLIHVSQDARPYSLVLFATILSFYGLILFIKKQNLFIALIYGIVSGFLLNTSFFGILTMFSHALIILVVFNFSKNKLIFLKNTFISAFIALLLFFPNYEKLQTLIGISSHWIPEPNLDTIIELFKEFLSRNQIAIYLFIVLGVFYLITIFKNIKNNSQNFLENKTLFGFFFVCVWFFVFAIVMYIKSVTSASVFLNRYLISLIPALLLMFSFSFSFIKSKYFRSTSIFILGVLLLIQTIFINKYYSTATKTQYRELVDNLNMKYENKDAVYSNLNIWINYFLIKNPNNIELEQIQSLDNVIDNLKNNPKLIKPFWYLNADVGEFNVSHETQLYLDQNFYIDYQFNGINSWSKHFALLKDKKQNVVDINVFEGIKNKYNGSQFPFSFEKIDDSVNDEITVKGWAYFPNQSADSIVKQIVLLDKNSKIKQIKTEQMIRKDVTSYFKSKFNIDNSGFEAKINISNLSEGEYKIGIYLFDKTNKKQGLNLSDFVFDK